MYGNRYKTLKKIISFLYIDGIIDFLLKGRVTERTQQKNNQTKGGQRNVQIRYSTERIMQKAR